jgi:mannitol/fructose-specific phosphotransferase system IIA component
MDPNIFSVGTKQEQENARKWLKSHLRAGPVKVAFLKKDGSERVMNCTLQEGVAIPHEKTTDRVKQTSDEVCPVWDIDTGAWRSFRYDSITMLTFDFMAEENENS